MSILEVVIFNVGMGQSILVRPQNQTDHACLIDCGSSDNFCPVDFLVDNQLLPHCSLVNKPRLGNFLLTNYDHDHFSSIHKLREKTHVWTTSMAKNIDSRKLKEIKEHHTPQLNHVCQIKDTYTSPAPDFQPVYTKSTYSLDNSELESDYNTNHLSQIVFITYGSSKLCVAGDLESSAWDILLQKVEVQNELRETDIFIAPHHGRENGFNLEIFKYCQPEVVVISDKAIVHGTQQHDLYRNVVKDSGIPLNGSQANRRKILTTRNDGHLLINMTESGLRSYQTLNI